MELRKLTEKDEKAFGAVARAFCREDSSFIFKGYMNYPTFLASLSRLERGEGLLDGEVPSTVFFAFSRGKIIGRLSIRHGLNNWLSEYGGHIGFFILSSQRGKGFATEMLNLAKARASALGLSRILITCRQDNPASIRVIEKCGGEFERKALEPEAVAWFNRYWMECGD